MASTTNPRTSPAQKKLVAASAPKKVAAKPKPKNGGATGPAVSADQRRHYIEVAAYFIAERHGFTPGRELTDWAAAEAEIDRLLASGRFR